MAQHDYEIANQSGLGFRTELNQALQAIVSQNSGDSPPNPSYAYQYWIDTNTTPAKLKQRDADNSTLWHTLGEISGQQLFADGTDQKPSISFANDTDTGLRRDGNNQISVVTDATERLTVHSNGYVAINTPVPLGELHVTGLGVFQKEGDVITIRNSTQEVGHIGEDTRGLYVNGAGAENTLTLSANGSTRAKITNAIVFYGNNGTGSYVFAKGGVTEIQAKVNFQNITQNRTYSFPDNTGTVVLANTLPSTIASKNVGTVGTYAFLTLRDTTGDKSSGTTTSGSNLRYSNANGNVGTGSPNGTWRLMGRLAGDPGNSEAKETSVWLRIS